NRAIQNAAKLAALIDILVEKGLLEPRELEERGKRLLLDLMMDYAERRIGVEYLDAKYDDPAPEAEAHIDCADRVTICKAVCCRLPFALTEKEVRKGAIRWDFGRPYLVARKPDGYCAHLDRDKFACEIYDDRPASCRLFDCRTDARWPVWEDFGAKTVNVDLLKKVFTSAPDSSQGR
ncbi:MAG: YkgJ family cysteine cluster protein, partial [Candidatus Coatesbacteria bacterium]